MHCLHSMIEIDVEMCLQEHSVLSECICFSEVINCVIINTVMIDCNSKSMNHLLCVCLCACMCARILFLYAENGNRTKVWIINSHTGTISSILYIAEQQSFGMLFMRIYVIHLYSMYVHQNQTPVTTCQIVNHIISLFLSTD